MRSFLLVTLIIVGSVLSVVKPALASGASLLVIGDSLSAAYGIDREQGWVQLLQQRLNKQGYDYQVINASVSGDTTRNGLSRLPPLLKQHHPDIVIIALGANDGLRGLDFSEIRKNLEQLILLSRQQGSRVLLAGVRLPPNYGADFNRQFAAIFQQLARRSDIPLVPHLLDQVSDHRTLMQADGMHPIARAQPQILDNVWSVLKPLLSKE